MTIVRERISRAELRKLAEEMFGNYVKAVVDIERRVMAVGGELHSDAETLLLDDGSRQQDIWGINIYPDAEPGTRIEFDSMINLRPWQRNRSRGVDDAETRRRVAEVVSALIRE